MLIKILFTLFLVHSSIAQKNKLNNIKIEQFNFCPNVPNPVGKIFANTTIKMTRGGIEFYGGGEIVEDVNKPLTLQSKIMKCETPNDCAEENKITIPEFCRLIKYTPILGKGLGDYFTPKLACPCKRGIYTANFTAPMSYVAMFPLGTALRKVQLTIYEVVSLSKKRVLACINGLIRTQPYSTRKN